MTAADDLTGIATDLAMVREMLAWCSTMAWWPAGRALDAPAGRALPPRAPDTDPDQVPGPRWALDVGDSKAQAAIRTALGHLGTVESRLYVALSAAIVRGQLPRRVPVRRPAPGPLMAEIQWLAVTLATHGLTYSDGDRRLIASARRAMDRAWRTLDSVMSTGRGGPDTHATAQKDRCRICGIRPKAAKKGARCETCARWKTRNGFERPKHLDSTTDARDAQARRKKRGDGFGDESLSSTSSGPIHSCTCTPTDRCGHHNDHPTPHIPECGTSPGYLRHRRQGEPPCAECAAAWEYERENLRAMIRTRHLEAS